MNTNNNKSGFIDRISTISRVLFLELLEELKKEHNLTESIYDLEIKHFTTYLYMLKNMCVYATKESHLKPNTSYFSVRDWEDFKFQLKERSKKLMDLGGNN